MIEFIKSKDALSTLINESCNELYAKINSLDVEQLPLEPFYKWYFNKCHKNRPIFSLKTSAKLLYDGLVATQKPLQEVVVMDYGAGLGTLYILAKMIGVKKIIYNDLLPEFASPAIAIDKIFGIIMDEYIIGDTISTCEQLQQKNIVCDLIVSRNVLEHIYDLGTYFKTIYQYQPSAILYNSTTANWRNPAAHIQHVLIHGRSREVILNKKLEIANKLIDASPKQKSISNIQKKALAERLLQYGGAEFTAAIENFIATNEMPIAKNDYTNVCDETGNWAEHLVPYSGYRKYASQYNITFRPGFWDTNYSSSLKTILGKTLNFFTQLLGDNGVLLSSFVYVIARPKTKT